MKIIYEGVDITSEVEISKACIDDNAGGKADSIDIIFADTEKVWRKWSPQKGETISLTEDGYSSGIMYIDETKVLRGKYIIRAISMPPGSKTPKTRSWENIRFLKMAKDLVNEIGLSLETYGVTDWLYDRVDQIEQDNIELLNIRCRMEGYKLKITNGKAVIYDEKTFEQIEAVKDIGESDFIGEYAFENISSGLYSSCLILYLSNKQQLIKYEFKPSEVPEGPILRPKIRVANVGEAERFSRNLLRNKNKLELTGTFTINLDTSIASGNTININNIGSFSSKYFIEKARHNFTTKQTSLNVRKILEGY